MSVPAGDPHGGEPVAHAGVALAQAAGVVVLLHGRGASAEDILGLAQAFYDPRLAYLAPRAAGHTWYPQSFLAPRELNEPWLSSALKKIEQTVGLAVAAGVPVAKIVLCGFSQGACLSTEFVATRPARYGGLIAYTGGLIGPPSMFAGELPYSGELEGMPAFLGSGDPDPHVPWERVERSAQVLRQMGASVATERYVGRPHTVSAQEIEIGRALVMGMLGG
jgi:predicted esterase